MFGLASRNSLPLVVISTELGSMDCGATRLEKVKANTRAVVEIILSEWKVLKPLGLGEHSSALRISKKKG